MQTVRARSCAREGTTSAAPETFLHRWEPECSPGLMTGYKISPWQSVAFCCPDKCQILISQKNPLPTRAVISSAQHSAVERWMGEKGKLLCRFWAIKWTGWHLTSIPCLWSSILGFAKLINSTSIKGETDSWDAVQHLEDVMFLSEAAVTAVPVTLRGSRNRTGKLRRILLISCLESHKWRWEMHYRKSFVLLFSVSKAKASCYGAMIPAGKCK